jgi:hypothetical protein
VDNVNRVNAPAFAAPHFVARHAPAEFCGCKSGWQDDNRCEKALRIATPRLTACDRTASIAADRPVVSTGGETAAHAANVLKCISTVSADFEHASVEPNIWVCIRSFEIEILPEAQLNRCRGNR